MHARMTGEFNSPYHLRLKDVPSDLLCVYSFISENSDVFVKSEKCIFSNFYPCTLTYENKLFKSDEHLYQFRKSIFHQQIDLAHLIIQSEFAVHAKKLSKQIPKSQFSHAWVNTQLKIMEKIIYRKCQQIPEFRRALINTGSSRLLHNVPHYFWGTGKHGTGRNHFRAILMKITMGMTM